MCAKYIRYSPGTFHSNHASSEANMYQSTWHLLNKEVTLSCMGAVSFVVTIWLHEWTEIRIVIFTYNCM